MSDFTYSPPSAPVISDPPPSYQAAVANTSNLDYVDFLPDKIISTEVRERTGKKYESFDVLIKRGNEWLARNLDKKVLTCESAEINMGYDGEPKTNESNWVEMGKGWEEEYIRILRLWVVNRSADELPEPQQIGHVNIVPVCLSGEELFHNPEFVDYPTTIANFNSQLQQHPLPGKIITIETQEMKFKRYTGELDPDDSHWKEGNDKSSHFVYVTRVFYIKGVPSYEQIGSVDFVPAKVNGLYEDVPTILNKAHHWVTQQQGISVTNVQSINYKIMHKNYVLFSGGGKLNTSTSCYREDDDGVTKFVRIIRIYFTRLLDYDGRLVTDVPTALTLRNFIPEQTEGGPGCCESFEFEDLEQTKERLTAWFKLSGARPLSAESVFVHQPNDLLTIEEVNSTMNFERGDSMKSFMNIFRVYFREPYVEPPSHLLPPPPDIKRGDNVCVMCCCCCCIMCYRGYCKSDDKDKGKEGKRTDQTSV